MSEAKIPILFDTDIGGDIDDAFCLAYLLRQPRCELLGVTTVTGQPVVRAQLVDAVCQAFGRKEVPIHSGAGNPLLGPQRQGDPFQKSVLPRWPHRRDFPENTAVDFLRETIRSRPGEITLLSVGPLTNIALLFAIDAEIPRLLKRWVLMGGQFVSRPMHYGLTEWNIICDPYAAAIALSARPAETLAIGLDVTTQCRMDRDEVRRRVSQGPMKVVGDMAEVWFEQREVVTFHDPLAAAVIFDPDICGYQPGLIDVELESQRLRGLTHFNAGAADKPHTIATRVDPDRFFQHYFGVIERG